MGSRISIGIPPQQVICLVATPSKKEAHASEKRDGPGQPRRNGTDQNVAMEHRQVFDVGIFRGLHYMIEA